MTDKNEVVRSLYEITGNITDHNTVLVNIAELETLRAGYAAARLEIESLRAAQPAPQPGTAYAALPTSSHAGRVYEEGFLIGTCPLYTADKMRAFADATHALRASHGQAPAQREAIDAAIAAQEGK